MIEKNKHMLKEVLDFPKLLSDGLVEGEKFEAEVSIENNTIIVVGMGASGLVGDYLKAYLAVKKPEINVFVYKSHLYPREKGLLVIYTYSGNTLETLKVLKEAVDKGEKNLFIVTSGGKAEEYAKKHGLSILRLPLGYQSRSHVPYGIGALTMFISKLLKIEGVVKSELEEAKKIIEDAIGDQEQLLKSYIELGKKIVGKKVPVILGDVQIEPVPLRFRNQFSENSKVFSLSDVFPEIGHNLLCSMTKNELLYPIIIKRTSADEVIKAYYEILRETLENKEKFEIIVDDGMFSWKTLLYPTFLADLMSIAFAEVHNVDAKEIPEVKFVKKWLKSVILV